MPPPSRWNSWTFWCSFLHSQEDSGTEVKTCLILTSVWLPELSPNVHTKARGRTPRPPYKKGVVGCLGLCWPGYEREERSAVHTIEGEGALGYVGVGGEIQVKCRGVGLMPYWLKRARQKLPCWLQRASLKLPRRIEKGAPKAGRFCDFFFFFRASSWGLIDSFRSR